MLQGFSPSAIILEMQDLQLLSCVLKCLPALRTRLFCFNVHAISENQFPLTLTLQQTYEISWKQNKVLQGLHHSDFRRSTIHIFSKENLP